MHFTKLVPSVFYTNIADGLKLFVDCLKFKLSEMQKSCSICLSKTLTLSTIISLIAFVLGASSCVIYKKNTYDKRLAGYTIVPTVCEFIDPDFDRGKFGIQIEFSCELPDSSLYMICNNVMKKVACNHYTNNRHTQYLIHKCEKQFYVLSKDKKVAGIIPYFEEYNKIIIHFGESSGNYMNEYNFQFYAIYR